MLSWAHVFKRAYLKTPGKQSVERERLGCRNNGKKVLKDVGDSS